MAPFSKYKGPGPSEVFRGYTSIMQPLVLMGVVLAAAVLWIGVILAMLAGLHRAQRRAERRASLAAYKKAGHRPSSRLHVWVGYRRGVAATAGAAPSHSAQRPRRGTKHPIRIHRHQPRRFSLRRNGGNT
ncbi:hypothetical protein CGK93_11530 [Arthrobacter sp. YN]|nr:hypothetical protein CGK93_11530 [Arthrobacter sp. YN]